MSGASDLSYTTSPLSEYLGSHIYEMLDIPVHETKMGYRNGKVVVGCKDFCAAGTKLLEMRTIKNAFLSETEEQVVDVEAVSKTGDQVSLEAQRLYLTYNPLLQHVPEASKRFWDMVVVDILIDNNDRNNGNWGLLINESSGTYTLAPVFDNSAAYWLGSFSFPLFLAHHAWSGRMNKLFPQDSYEQLFVKYALLSFATAVLVSVLSGAVRRIYGKHREQLRGLFVKTEKSA